MKHILPIVFFNLFYLINSIASECPTFPVHRRVTPNSKIQVYKTCIMELKGKSSFETNEFKIVLGTSEVPIPFSKPEYLQKAATTLYHLQIAKNYFSNTFGQESISHIEKLTIRIDMTRSFLDIAHFAGEHLPKQFNNALTIPPSDEHRIDRYPPWNYEIWFRPAKKKKIDFPLYMIGAPLSDQTIREEALITSAGGAIIDNRIGTGLDELALILGIHYVIPEILNMFQGSVKSSVYLDSALIPEIIYHEFVHAALGSYLFPRQSTALIEGLANYYAAKISKGFRVGHKAGKRDKGVVARNGSKISHYHPKLETRMMAQNNYTFQLLTHVSNIIPRNLGEKIIYHSLQELSNSSDIKYDLMSSITRSIKSSKLSQLEKYNTLMQLNKIAKKFGL